MQTTKVVHPDWPAETDEKIGASLNLQFVVLPDGTVTEIQPTFLRVDGNPVHRAAPDRFGGAGWSGPEAAKIIDELKAGTGVVVRSFAAGSGAARDEFLSLGGFGDALTAYRGNLRTFGILVPSIIKG